MRILLVKPYWPYPYSKGEYTYNYVCPPLCLAYCAALLEKNGHKADIIDAHALRVPPRKIANFIDGYDKIFITSSTLDKWLCPNIDISHFLETVQHIRDFSEEIYVMGYHGTVEPEKILNLTKAKAIIRGEPEYTVLDICQKNNLSEIEGITFKNNSEIISNPSRELIDLKSLPTPAFHLLDFRRYFYELLGGNFSLFEISRGCKYRCRFCNKVMYSDTLRTKSKEQIIEEVAIAIEKYNVRTGYFMDLDFFSDRETAELLCDFLIKKKYNFRWACQTRPGSLNRDILKKMKRGGCKLVHLGVESGIQRLLNYLRKNVTIEDIEESVNLCKQVGIKTLAFFVFGLPEESEEDRKLTFNFAYRLDTDFVSFHRLYPYKGTEIYGEHIKMNTDIDRFIYKALIKYYLRLSYIWRLDLSVILSGLRLFIGRIKTLELNRR